MPLLFTEIATRGNVADEEMYRVFNMGIGLVLVVSPQTADLMQRFSDSRVIGAVHRIGQIVTGNGVQLI